MQMSDVSRLATSLDGVVERRTDGLLAWRHRSRLVARQLDETHVVVRTSFDARDVLVRTHPDTFSVPARFTKHMMVVADCERGDADAIEEAIVAAWRLQRDG